MTGVRFVLLEDWSPAPRRPLVLAAGDVVRVGERDTDWTAYLWCTGPDGAGGWVPQDYLIFAEDGTATVSAAYSTVELAAKAGDVVSGYQTAGAWTWCVDGSGTAGWLPNRVLGRTQHP